MEANVKNTTVGKLALDQPTAIAVFEKWHIDYCCRGNRTLAQACDEAGIAIDEVVAAIGPSRTNAPTSELRRKNLTELQKYIVATHHLFTREALETVGMLSEKVATRHGANHAETTEVRTIVAQLVADLLPHMLKEEQVIFPYVEALEKASRNGQSAPVPFFGTVKNPIRMMMMEHDAVGVLLADLRVVTSNYTLPSDACLSFRALYERLAELEEDLHRHIHLENNLLFPRAAELEETAGSSPAFEVKGEHCSCTG
ncbi:MAG TPA: iron-sulfur cluster repair di-iron protein [Thermoanaerobaculia bacterium]